MAVVFLPRAVFPSGASRIISDHLIRFERILTAAVRTKVVLSPSISEVLRLVSHIVAFFQIIISPRHSGGHRKC